MIVLSRLSTGYPNAKKKKENESLPDTMHTNSLAMDHIPEHKR